MARAEDRTHLAQAPPLGLSLLVVLLFHPRHLLGLQIATQHESRRSLRLDRLLAFSKAHAPLMVSTPRDLVPRARPRQAASIPFPRPWLPPLPPPSAQLLSLTATKHVSAPATGNRSRQLSCACMSLTSPRLRAQCVRHQVSAPANSARLSASSVLPKVVHHRVTGGESRRRLARSSRPGKGAARITRGHDYLLSSNAATSVEKHDLPRCIQAACFGTEYGRQRPPVCARPDDVIPAASATTPSRNRARALHRASSAARAISRSPASSHSPTQTMASFLSSWASSTKPSSVSHNSELDSLVDTFMLRFACSACRQIGLPALVTHCMAWHAAAIASPCLRAPRVETLID